MRSPRSWVKPYRDSTRLLEAWVKPPGNWPKPLEGKVRPPRGWVKPTLFFFKRTPFIRTSRLKWPKK